MSKERDVRGEEASLLNSLDFKRKLETLTELQRGAIVRHDIEKRSLKECAEELGLSTHVFKKVLEEARKRMEGT
jgi:DNA-directed RNA polymerase specialized sigma24 family protein